jgi:hypothetical protein
MENLSSLVLLSVLAGAVHVVSPDHWVPASILGWQRRWSVARTSIFVVGLLLLHLIAGFFIYLLLDRWFMSLDSKGMVRSSLAIVFLVMTVRAVRFSSIPKVQSLGLQRWNGLWAVLSLLGPCESILPVLMKSKVLGLGYLVPFCAFGLGTVVAGPLLVISSQWFWNRPFGLTQILSWIDRRIAVVPVVACLVLGLRFLLKLS